VTGLSGLSLSDGVLNPAFDTGVMNYSSSVEYTIDAVQITPTSVDPGSTIVINNEIVQSGLPSAPIGLTVGANSIVINVTAEDGVANEIYNIEITRGLPSTNADLSGLTISLGVISPIFMSDITEYSSNVSFVDTSVQITGITDDSNATLTVNNIDTLSGNPSQPAPLGEGSNLVTIIVTAQDGLTRKTYSVLVDRQPTGDFIQQAYIKASNTDDNGNGFGGSVALSGDTLVVGAQGEDSNAIGVNGNQADNSASGAGAVYVFTRDLIGTWSQQAYIKASNTDAGDGFGRDVAISDDTLVVSSIGEKSNAVGVNGNQADNSAGAAGAVYVFTRDLAGTWSQQAYIKASNTDADDRFAAGDRFGTSISLDGDTLVVGAVGEDSNATGVNGNQADNSADTAGAVYVFTRDLAGTWSQQAYIKASNAGMGDAFGWDVVVAGDRMAAGAIWEDSNATGINGDQTDNSNGSAGAVYLFTRDMAGIWSQQAYVKASTTLPSTFGQSLALTDDTPSTLAVGSNRSVYVFTGDVSWSQQARIVGSNTKPGSSDFGDGFGSAVSLSTDTLAVGAPGEDSNATGVNGDQLDNSSEQSGAVYIFTRSANLWTQQSYIKPSNTDAGDLFGYDITLSNDTLAVGAFAEESNASSINGNQADNSASYAGAVYVYH
jgi:hypothetical protein